MSTKRDLVAKNVLDTTRSAMLARVPAVINILYSIIEQDTTSSHNANDKLDPAFERIRIADQRVQLGAINSWLDRAGVIPPKAQAERPADLQLADMTVTELRRLAETLDGEIAERAKVVPAPELAPADSQGIDSLM